MIVINLIYDTSGTECHETVYLINDEAQAYSFSFVETSCYCDGHTARVKVQPMSGTLQPNSRYAQPMCIYYNNSMGLAGYPSMFHLWPPERESITLTCSVK